jgi:hypothetical protein
VKTQPDILFAIGIWILSSALFVFTYNMLPDPPDEIITVPFHVHKKGRLSAIEKSKICIGTARAYLTEDRKTEIAIQLRGVQVRRSVEPPALNLTIAFDEQLTLHSLQGTVTAPKTKLRLTAQGRTPLRISLAGKLEGKTIADAVEIPGPVTLSKEESSSDTVLFQFPRKGLLRSGLLEYGQGAFLNCFSFSEHL